MAQYSRTVLTDAGVILARRIMDDETLTMEFTRIQTGSGEYSSGEDIASRTSLKAPKQSFPISSRSVTSEQVLHLKYVVSNVNPDLSPLTVGYYVRELAIYAQVSGEAEILYAIAIADADSADYLPEYDELQPTTITMDWFLPVGNAEQINVYASPDAYALAEDLEALALVVDDKLDADGDSAGNTVTFTSSDVPDSSVTKDTGWTTSGALSSGETHESFMTKISRMIKNIRWIYKLIGTTDISSIGNGTITGGLSSLNDSFAKRFRTQATGTGRLNTQYWQENTCNYNIMDNICVVMIAGHLLQVNGYSEIIIGEDFPPSMGRFFCISSVITNDNKEIANFSVNTEGKLSIHSRAPITQMTTINGSIMYILGNNIQ